MTRDEIRSYFGDSKIMTDFLDKEIQVGDKIVYCRSRKNGFDMIKTEVVGFTERMIKIPKLSLRKDKDYSVVSPKNCIVYQSSVKHQYNGFCGGMFEGRQIQINPSNIETNNI